jgi:hypothetical protein
MTFKIRIFLNPPSGCGCCGNSWQLDSTVIRVFAFVKNLKSEFGGVKKTNSAAGEINSS